MLFALHTNRGSERTNADDPPLTRALRCDLGESHFERLTDETPLVSAISLMNNLPNTVLPRRSQIM